MPFTPFHLGPALLLSGLAPRRLDLPTLLVASVVIDVRAALVVFGPLGGPVHGPLTTFLGATVVATLVAGAALSLPARLGGLADRVRPDATVGTAAVAAGALAGAWSHVLLDAALYHDVAPFFPLAGNPFLVDAFGLVYGACVAAGLAGAVLLAARYARSARTDTS
ncbi:hypothetical protein C475_08286 [Halosimplex carlsbadense 2-9-1]|uniref:Membrane-bound metal-dependent hydrolase n=1 Tax=Halosimplex carlsbadense 2-9-1 TaxID=797114 RepID=M0CW92_9EURY|nr:hypothetical protein [Halosimplex carlsbadense]ELZ26918.1 hypothetical protein C475_08286 [Halosimplex carlsbadense 2-9-1]